MKGRWIGGSDGFGQGKVGRCQVLGGEGTGGGTECRISTGGRSACRPLEGTSYVSIVFLSYPLN